MSQKRPYHDPLLDPPLPPHAPVEGLKSQPRDLAFERGLPVSLDAERFTIGSILLDGRKFEEVAAVLKPEHFSLEKNNRIYSRMGDLHERGQEIDRVTVAEELMRQGQLESIDGLAYLSSLDEGLPELANLDAYVRLVLEKYNLRKIIFEAQRIQNAALSGSEFAADIASHFSDRMQEVAQAAVKDDDGKTAEQIAADYPGGVGSFLDPSTRQTGLKTGFTRLDEATNGLHPGELTILAARPSIGKTACALNIADFVARHSGKMVYFFSLEMSAALLLTRLLCSAARVDAHKFRCGFLNSEERRRLQVALYDLSKLPLKIFDIAGIDMKQLSAIVRRGVKKDNLGLTVVDYLQLMSMGKAENRNIAVGQVSRGMKLLVRETGTSMIALSQLSRPDKTARMLPPTLQDLRDSGCLSGDSLIVMADGTRKTLRSLVGASDLCIMGMDQETLKVRPFPISKAFCSGTKAVFKLKLQTGKELIATGNHKFRTMSDWKRLDELKPKDYVATPRELQSPGSESMDLDELALLAHVIGNGSVLEGQPAHYTTFDKDVADIVAATAKRFLGSNAEPHVKSAKTYWNVFFNSVKAHTHGVRSELRIWLDHLGLWDHRAPIKFIPEVVFAQPTHALAWFIGNLWSTDGCIMPPRKTGTPCAYYSTSSPRLADDVQYALLRFGIRSRKVPIDQKLSDLPNWHVTISGVQDLDLFCRTFPAVGARREERRVRLLKHCADTAHNTNLDVIPSSAWGSIVKLAFRSMGMTDRSFQEGMGWSYSGSTRYKHGLSRQHAGRIADFLKSDELKTLSNSDLYWDRIVSIEPAGEIETFDLTVPGCSNFVANNIIVHNSLEQDADNVHFIWREEVVKPDRADLKGLAEIIISKQRNGPILRVPLRFLGAFTRFENRASDLDDISPDEESRRPEW